jgi:flagellar assembly factor FliW
MRRRMPFADTRRFGALEYSESSVVTFLSGPPGFEDQTRFALVERPEMAPVVFLQSLDRAELCFLAAPVEALLGDYELAMTREDLEGLGMDGSRQPVPGREVLCLALLCAPEKGPVTANLLAPVVVNLDTRAAVQAIRSDARYSHQHAIRGETSRQEGSREDEGSSCW